jgi:hypothetical protein
VLPRAGAHLEAHFSAGAPQKTMERSTMLFSWVKSLCWVVYGCRFMVDISNLSAIFGCRNGCFWIFLEYIVFEACHQLNPTYKVGSQRYLLGDQTV